MRYIAKILKVSLTKKFPSADKEDIYKVHLDWRANMEALLFDLPKKEHF